MSRKAGLASYADGSREAPVINSPEERIIAAAYECFDRFGIRKTTIEDIASAAGLSRPTVYNYFSNKDEIVDQIKTRESAKVNAVLRSKVDRRRPFKETLADCLVVSTRLSADNAYVRALIESSTSVSRTVEPGSAAHKRSREWWGGLLDRGVANGDLSTDITVDEAVSWLVLAQVMLLIKVGAGAISDDELRAFIARFVVGPLLSPTA